MAKGWRKKFRRKFCSWLLLLIRYSPKASWYIVASSLFPYHENEYFIKKWKSACLEQSTLDKDNLLRIPLIRKFVLILLIVILAVPAMLRTYYDKSYRHFFKGAAEHTMEQVKNMKESAVSDHLLQFWPFWCVSLWHQ